MRVPTLILAALVAGALSLQSVAAEAPPGERIVAARLVSERTALVSGADAWLALHLRIREGWHVYWKNPGDSGTPPRLAWRLPDGVAVDDFVWPAPSRFVADPLASFGYEREVYFPVRAVVASDATGPVRLEATAKWLACQVDCIPESAELSLTLPVGGRAADGPAADGIRAALATVPRVEPAWRASFSEAADTLKLRVSMPPAFASDGYSYLFFPDTGGLVEASAPQPVDRGGDGITLALTKAATRTAPVESLAGVLVARPEDGTAGGAAAIELTATRAAAGSGLWAALGLAFVGGLLLNLMPCVFPVIAIKVMGFVDEAGSGGRAAVQGLAFAAGVVASFWALAGVLLALRAAGAEIGWGFQLQSPPFVLAMAFLFFVLAIAFLGGVDLGGRVATLAGGVRARRGLGGSFLSGALATAVATPCTAPFMGTALGWALTAPPATALVVFTALALGTALPYVVLSASPGLVRALPRPGPWMETLKQLLAFPLLATVVWLLWVFGLQAGADAWRSRSAVSSSRRSACGSRAGRRRPPRPRGAGGRRRPPRSSRSPSASAWPCRGRARGGDRVGVGRTRARARVGAVLGGAPRRAPRRGAAGLRRLHRRVVPDVPAERARGVRVGGGARGIRAPWRGADARRLDESGCGDHSGARGVRPEWRSVERAVW
jgi:thiol:disulfide interchange protein DsbD